jgi:hypothetical protein
MNDDLFKRAILANMAFQSEALKELSMKHDATSKYEVDRLSYIENQWAELQREMSIVRNMAGRQ